jgi:pyruvate, orthophosphate dikinase
MVFGNMGDDSATGVAFTRNPSTGEAQFFGEYLLNAQGEDVVAGIRTPFSIESLKGHMPEAYSHLERIYKTLEAHYRDMQDIEFTIEKGRLWMLQTRSGKRTARAALKMAYDMVQEGLITEKEALLRLDPSSLDQLLHPTLDPQAKKELLAKGLPASPGGVSGHIVFSSEEAVIQKELGQNVILVRVETSPEDIAGMNAARGILTSRGGMTSHAAVVARGMGKCCVAGCTEIEVFTEQKILRIKGYVFKEGDLITLDGSTGEVFLGEVKTISPELSSDFNYFMKLADSVRKMKVRTNADTPRDAQVARDFGAEGIGLCRTEHMFFGPERIDVMRR